MEAGYGPQSREKFRPLQRVRKPTTPESSPTSSTRPLLPVENLSTPRTPPSFSLCEASPTERALSGGKRSGVIQHSLSTIPSATPRIRSKLTMGVSPRAKLLDTREDRAPPWASTSNLNITSNNPFLAKIDSLNATPSSPRTDSDDGRSNFADGGNQLESGRASKEGGEVTSRRGKENVLVCVRVRPPAQKLASAAHQVVDELAWDADRASARIALAPTHGKNATEYSFDSLVTGSNNEEVYAVAARDLVLDSLAGFDAVIFAYGQTASGKSFTISGNAQNPGIIPQSVEEIFLYIKAHPEREFLLRASYIEIYNETLKDLLSPETGPLRIRQDELKRFFVSPLREEVVTSEAHVADLIARGESNRSTGKTDFNERSSRSHSLFQMTIESRESSVSSTPRSSKATSLNDSEGAVRMSRLSLIDLAGSETAVSDAARRAEGAFINKSLLTLEKVIASLTDDAKNKRHVPYRDSKLTQILQPSLSGSALVSVIATINPSPTAIAETTSTLKFAQRVKEVIINAAVREVVDDRMLITKYRSEIARLEAELAIASAITSTPRVEDVEAKRRAMEEQRRMNAEINELRDLFLTSGNVEHRRNSALPPRAVSPMKMGRSSTAASVVSLEEKYQDSIDALAEAQDKVSQLHERIDNLEEENTLLRSAPSSTSHSHDIIAQLSKENQELKTVNLNTDFSAQERKFERMTKRIQASHDFLAAQLEQERSKNKKFEKYIIQHLTESIQPRPPRGPTPRVVSGGTYGGFLAPLQAVEFELEEDDFSEESKGIIQRSASRLF